MLAMVSGEFISNLLSESYETLIEEAEIALGRQAKDILPTGVGDFHLVGTFSHHAIVSTDSGDFFRLRMERLDDGGIGFYFTEQIDVPVIRTKREKDGFIKEQSDKIVDDLLSGDSPSARNRLRALMGSSELVEFVDQSDDVSNLLSDFYGDDRPWKAYLKERMQDVRKLLWGKSGASFKESASIKPKYRRVYKDDSPERFYPVVSSDLANLREKVRSLYDGALTQYARFSEQTCGCHDLEVSDIAENLNRFASDWAGAIKGTLTLMNRAVDRANKSDTRWMAMVYDTVAENLVDIDVASRFVGLVSRELLASST
jgi:hypothetical protein